MVIIFLSLIHLLFNPNDTAFKNDVLMQVNQIRAKGCNCGGKWMKPAGALKWDSRLEKSAVGHASDMNRLDFFDHIGKDGRDFSDRIKDAGFNWSYAGENIAWGQKTINEVVKSWKDSPGHCRQMMHPKYTKMGVAKVGTYWVQDFGRLMNE